MTDGNRANKSGRVLENVVEAIYRSHGYEIIPYADYIKDTGEPTGRRLLLKHVLYTSIYGNPAPSAPASQPRLISSFNQSLDRIPFFQDLGPALPENQVRLLKVMFT